MEGKGSIIIQKLSACSKMDPMIGLFAIVNATALCLESNPVIVVVSGSKTKRQHLAGCIRNGKLKVFPL